MVLRRSPKVGKLRSGVEGWITGRTQARMHRVYECRVKLVTGRFTGSNPAFFPMWIAAHYGSANDALSVCTRAVQQAL